MKARIDYRNKIYKRYISNGFKDSHSANNEQVLQGRYFKKNYLKYLPLNREAKILDLGCGMGQFVRFCEEEKYTNIIGIDISRENIKYCNALKTKHVQFIEIDIVEFLKGHLNEFDCIIFNDVIEHLTKEEIILVLDAIYCSLKENGNVIIKTPNMSNLFVNTAGRYIDFTHETGFTETSMRQVLNMTKFKNIKILGTDIYVLNPLLSHLAKLFSKILNLVMYFLSCLYGRTSLHIFEKDILAIGYKNKNRLR